MARNGFIMKVAQSIINIGSRTVWYKAFAGMERRLTKDPITDFVGSHMSK